MSDYQHALQTAIEAAREAGAILRNDLHRPDGPRGGGSHADADDEAEHVIRQRLLAATDWSYLGEETGSHEGRDLQHRWLVDPNDGTAAYLKGWRGSAVSIAALRDDVPVLGVVFAFAYPDDDGDLIAWAEDCGPITRNGQPVSTDLSSASLDAKSIVYVSQDADRRAEANQKAVHPARFIAMPSIAYRLALTAAGDGVAGVSLSGPGAWDYAAGHALLRGAGWILLDERGREVSYSSGRSSTQFCFGGTRAACEALCRRDWSALLSGRSHAVALIRPERGRLIRDPGKLSRAQGCLLGQLAGDSLGGLVEFQGPKEIRRKYPHGLQELADGGTWGILAGQPTDDSELALMLARTLAKGAFDDGPVLAAYRSWQHSGPFDIGITTRRGLAGQPDMQSQANGSLMRISPLGVFGARRPDDAAIWARADSRMTHPNSVCQDACAAFVVAIAEAITNGCGPKATYEAAQQEASKPGFSPTVRECLDRASIETPSDFMTHQGWVLVALQNAFFQLLHAESLAAGLSDTVMRGGDTDTNAAIAGALLGAVHGRDAIPSTWRRALLSCRPLSGTPTAHPRPMEFWPIDALELAERLLVTGAEAAARLTART
jgi:ADP-ribosylglycohydrolase/fructose-1,6-bisphosphatase/inositol monophosphatase family enzyme